mgnify:CR=1 FL=1
MSGTESNSYHENLEKKSLREILLGINEEDQKVAGCVKNAIPQIEKLADVIHQKMSKGGRLFYIGSGTSGRLGIVDASECPPTYGVEHELVIGLIAGGDSAIRKAVEFAEDDTHQGWKDLKQYDINEKDVVVGIAASGKTPYVLGAIQACNDHGIVTGGITCNSNTKLAALAKFPVEILVGPEYVTGSTRMKSGTAQKLALNMLSTTVMIKLGKVKGNKMVDMQLSNEKLVDRGTRMIVQELSLSYEKAKQLLLKFGSVRKAIDNYQMKD